MLLGCELNIKEHAKGPSDKTLVLDFVLEPCKHDEL
jgi:hypothetical protein